MKNKTLHILFLLYSFTSSSQISFENIYSSGGYDYARAIHQTSDKGYVAVGSTEGNFGVSDLYILKIDSFGDISWTKKYGGNNIDWAQDVIETYDSNLLIVGYTNSNTINNNYNIYIIKTNKNGDSIFTKKINWNYWNFAYSVQETTDSGYIIAGETYIDGNSKALLLKLDRNGDTLWSKTYGGIENDKFDKVIITSNGDYLMAGTTESFGNQQQAYIVKTDNMGNLIWEKNFGNAQNDFAKSLLELNTGEIIFVGGTNTAPENDYDNWVVKLDALGSEMNNSIITDYTDPNTTEHNNDYFEAIIETQDSLFIFGNRSYVNSNNGNVFAALADKNANINLSRYFLKSISSEFESFHDAKKTSDNGVIIVGTSEGIGSGGSSIYIVKMDSSLAFPQGIHNGTIQFKNDISNIKKIISKEKNNYFSCFPNPIKNTTTFKVENNKINQSIKVFTIEGKVIETISINSSEQIHNFNSYKNGIYLASLFVKDRFVKQIKVIISK